MTLSEKQIDSLNKRLHFTATLTSFLKDASKLFSSLSSYAGLKPSQCVERLDKIPPFSVYAVFLVAPEGKPKQALEKYLGQWRHIQPKTTGHDLKKLGLKPGPKYQKILWSLRAAWLDGHVSSFAQEQNLLNSLVHNK
jgi:tRNA nucleotidyltransferase (CCA-adding enzyme)